MDKLKDIKTIIDIPDNSFIYLIIIICIIFILLSFIIYYFVKNNKKIKNDDKKIALKLLKNQNFNDSKTVAYNFKKYAFIFITAENENFFNDINKKLVDYKYKKQVANLKPELIKQIKDFIKNV